MVRTTFQLESTGDSRITSASDNWPRRRLEAACQRAEREDSAASWRTLRNLAAAYGCIDLAREAHRRLEESKSACRAPADELSITNKSFMNSDFRFQISDFVPSAAIATRIATDTLQSEISNPNSEIVNRTTIRFRIDSPTPRARAAWLKKWCQSRGFQIEAGNGNFFVCISPPDKNDGDDIINLLRTHSEISCDLAELKC